MNATPDHDGSLQCVVQVHLRTCRAAGMRLVHAAQPANLLATCDGV